VWLFRSHEGEGSALITETLARALPRVRERAYPQVDYRWSTRPHSSGVVLLSYEQAGTDSVMAPVTEIDRGAFSPE